MREISVKRRRERNKRKERELRGGGRETAETGPRGKQNWGQLTEKNRRGKTRKGR